MKLKLGKISIAAGFDPKRLFRQPRTIELPVGLNTDDTITTRFVPLTKLGDLEKFSGLLGKIQDGTKETLLSIADNVVMQHEFNPLFKAVCPDLTAVGDWKDLNAEAKIIILQELYKSEGGETDEKIS